MNPLLIHDLKKGITDPREHKTFPYLTTEKDVFMNCSRLKLAAIRACRMLTQLHMI